MGLGFCAGGAPQTLAGISTAANHGEWDAIYGFVQNKAQALLDVSFYKVCDDQEGKIMFERLITAIIMVVAVAIVASGLPLSSISGAGSGALGFFNHTTVF
jgi:hypothetical protein